MVPFQDKLLTGKVRQRKRDSDGTLKGTSDGSLKGTSHENSMFDTRAYIIDFPDGAEAEYTANIIAENMYARFNPDGKHTSP